MALENMRAVQVRSPEEQEKVEKHLQTEQTPERLERVNAQLAELEQLLDLLTRKLGAVLSPQADRPSRVAELTEPQSELADRLYQLALRTENSVEYVRELLLRVDL